MVKRDKELQRNHKRLMDMSEERAELNKTLDENKQKIKQGTS